MANQKMQNLRFYGTGKRKTAIARVYLWPGKGEVRVNGKELASYFNRKSSQMVAMQPIEMLRLTGRYDLMIKVHGGGDSSQAGAVRLGIARALLQCDAKKSIELDPELILEMQAESRQQQTAGASAAAVSTGDDQVLDAEHAASVSNSLAKSLSAPNNSWLHQKLRRLGFLTRDARKVERKKVGLHKARKATQFSKR